MIEDMLQVLDSLEVRLGYWMEKFNLFIILLIHLFQDVLSKQLLFYASHVITCYLANESLSRLMLNSIGNPHVKF